MFEAVAYAATFDEFLGKVIAKIVNPLIEFSFIVGLVVFLFGLMEFIRGANNEEKRSKGKQHMLWGIIGFVIMFGVFGIITFLTNTFGIKGVKINNDEQTFCPPPIQDLRIDGKTVTSFVPCEKK